MLALGHRQITLLSNLVLVNDQVCMPTLIGIQQLWCNVELVS